MNELEIQSHLIRQIKIDGGWGCKMNNKFLAGIPDLLLAHPLIGTGFAEVKIVKSGGLVLLTPLQKETLKRMRGAKMHVGVIAVEQKEDTFYCHVTENLELTKVNLDWTLFFKHRGGLWPSYVVLEELVRLSAT